MNTSLDLLAKAHDSWSSAHPSLTFPISALRDLVARNQIEERHLLNRAMDICLATACCAGMQGAVNLFENFYIAAASGYLRRYGDHDLLLEVQQSLRIKMLVGPPPRLRLYNGRAPLAHWVRIAATRLALDELERRARQWSRLVAEADYELDAVGRIAQHSSLATTLVPMLRETLEHQIRSLSSKERALLKFHFIDGLSVDALAPHYKVHRSTVARWISSTRHDLSTRLQNRLCAQFPAISRTDLMDLMMSFADELGNTVLDILKSSCYANDGEAMSCFSLHPLDFGRGNEPLETRHGTLTVVCAPA